MKFKKMYALAVVVWYIARDGKKYGFVFIEDLCWAMPQCLDVVTYPTYVLYLTTADPSDINKKFKALAKARTSAGVDGDV